METTEKVVEAYVRYVKGWATIPNIKCDGQFEIDLLAIDPKCGEKYHIESGVSVSGAYSKLTAKPYDPELIKVRVHQAGQRRTLGYFAERKFSAPGIIKALTEYGFDQGHYQKIIVTWDCDADVEALAASLGITIWNFQKLLKEISQAFRNKRSYFTDDTLRTLQLYAMAIKE